MNVLLIGAVGRLFSALVLAWVATFAKLIVVQPVQALVKDYGSLISVPCNLRRSHSGPGLGLLDGRRGRFLQSESFPTESVPS
jgi:hypothetical protein